MKHFLLSVVTCLCLVGCKSSEPSNTSPLVNVSVQRTKFTDASLTVIAPAELHGITEAHLSSRITAPVARLLVHKGERVKQGQLLAVLSANDLAAQREIASADVANAEAALEKIQQGSLPAQLVQAQGELKAKQAALDLAARVYNRRKDLYAQGAISERELQTSQADLTRAQADFNAAQSNLNAIEKHTSADDLRMAKSTLERSKASASLAKADASFSELRSPSNGVVIEQNVFPGDLAEPSTTLLTIADLSRVVARSQVSEADAGTIKVGQPCAFSIKGENTQGLSGKITMVNRAIDPVRRTVEVWCELPNGRGELRAGEFGSVQVSVGVAKHAIIVQASAVEFEEGTHDAKVFVVDEKRIAHQRRVTAVPLNDKSVHILSGLQPGETVITDGEYGMPDGTAITVAGEAR